MTIWRRRFGDLTPMSMPREDGAAVEISQQRLPHGSARSSTMDLREDEKEARSGESVVRRVEVEEIWSYPWPAAVVDAG